MVTGPSANAHDWLCRCLRDQPVAHDLESLVDAAEAFDTVARTLNLPNFDRALFTFAMQAGVRYSAQTADAWCDAVESAIRAAIVIFDGADDPEVRFTGLYMTWEVLLIPPPLSSLQTGDRGWQRLQDLIAVQLSSNGNALKRAALHGLNHLDTSVRRAIISAAIRRGDIPPAIQDFARSAMRGELL